MANMTNSHASLPPLLSEVERRLYINNDPAYHLFLFRVDEAFIKPFLAPYEQNAAEVETFAAGLVEELGLEDVSVQALLPKRVATQTAAQFVQSQLF